MVSKPPWNAEAVELKRKKAWWVSNQDQKKSARELIKVFYPSRKEKILASSSK
jgi:hypothetical protein